MCDYISDQAWHENIVATMRDQIIGSMQQTQSTQGDDIVAAIRERIIAETRAQYAHEYAQETILRTQEALMDAYDSAYCTITGLILDTMKENVKKFPLRGTFGERIKYAYQLVVIQCRIHATHQCVYASSRFWRRRFPLDPIDTYDESIDAPYACIFNGSPLYEVLHFYRKTSVSLLPEFAKILDKASCIYNEIQTERQRREDAFDAIFVPIHERMCDECISKNG